MGRQRLSLKLPVRGDLDTASPISDRPPGTLVVSKDVSPRYWGPRRGSNAFTRVWEGPGVMSLYDQIDLDGTGTGASAYTKDAQFRTLGTQFTLDLWFRLDNTSYATGKQIIWLYSYYASGSLLGKIQVFIAADANVDADEGEIVVAVRTTDASGTPDTIVVVGTDSDISVGPEQDKRHHVRIVRDGANLYTYKDGELVDTDTSLSATNGITDPNAGVGSVYLGTDPALGGTNVTWNGAIYGAVLRDGAFNSQPISAMMPCNPWAPNVHHYYIGSSYHLGGDNHFYDLGRYQAHAKLDTGSGFSLSGAKDDNPPAPAIVQGLESWTTRTNSVATSVMVGGQLCTSLMSDGAAATNTPQFRFRNADTSRGLIAAGEGSTEQYHPVLPTHLFGASGFLLILNGYNLNRRMDDVVGYDDTAASAIQLLQMRGPRQPISPLISAVGTGRVFRLGAKWRYRWLNSRTGEHSGLSPIPAFSFNMGQETPAGSQTYLGQTATFYLPTADAPAPADTLQLFANTSQQDAVWYLADEAEIAGASYVHLTDDFTDDELFTKLAVVTGSPSASPAGPSWSEGVMWPVAKAWLHPNGAVFYYGLRRFKDTNITNPNASVTQGSDLVSLAAGSAVASTVVAPGRVGQRVRFYTGSTVSTEIDDPTVYRFLKAASANSFRVHPELQISTTLAEDASATTWHVRFTDDRDARFTWMSEPRKPWLIDPLKTLAAGDDFDDGVLHWFTFDNKIYLQTRRQIYEAAGAASDDPSRSTLFFPKASEGSVGLWAGCETPFGWVYVNEKRGVRVFDGTPFVRPLGRQDVFGDFLPKDQFERFESSMLASVVVAYDDRHRVLLVSYVPTGQSRLKEVLAFDTATRSWRGPYRERLAAAGDLRSTTGADEFTYGDDFGNLLVRQAQDLDVQDGGTGTVTSWLNTRFLTDSAAAFDATTQSERGAPVWLTDGTDSYIARVAHAISTTQVELDGPMMKEDGTYGGPIGSAPSYGIGTVRWELITSYLEAQDDDPTRELEFYGVGVRYKRATTGTDSFEAGFAEDANGTYAGTRLDSSTETAATDTTLNKVSSSMRLKRAGKTGQLRMRGTSRASSPQIGKANMLIDVRDGDL